VTRGAWDRVGAALFAGPATGYATDTHTSAFRSLSGLPSTPVATFSLLAGGTSVCGDLSGMEVGITSCVSATADRSEGIVLFYAPGGGVGSTAARLRSGDVWLNSQAVPSGAVSLVARAVPKDALRPTITSVPDRMRIGVPTTLQGTRFASPASRGGVSTHPMPGVVPLVTFVPALEGAPVGNARRRSENPATPPFDAPRGSAAARPACASDKPPAWSHRTPGLARSDHPLRGTLGHGSGSPLLRSALRDSAGESQSNAQLLVCEG
jgi:hypothetical protein